MTRPRRLLTGTLIALALIVVAIQAVPYGRRHDNPPVTGAPAWDSARTEHLARRACFDCHSHETKWPWYANIAPVSWRIQRHVDEGRRKMNLSVSGRGLGEVDEAAEELQSGAMPPWDYVLAHPEARLTEEEKQALTVGLTKTFPSAESGKNAAGAKAGTRDRDGGDGGR